MKKEKDIISTEHRSNGLLSFSADISDFAAKLLGKHGLIEMKLLTNWKNIAGDNLAKYSVPDKIVFHKDKRDEGILYLIVSNGAYALEISHKSPLILEKINTFFGYKAITQIKITQNESSFSYLDETKFDDNQNKKLVSEEEQNYINQITQDIKNTDLRERLRSLGKNIYKQNK